MYEEIKHSEAMTQPITAPPQPGQASGNGDYEMTDCPAYATTNTQSSSTAPPLRVPASGNGDYEMTECPAYAPTNTQSSSTREELDDREYEVINL